MTPRAKPFHLANTRLGTPASTNRTGVKAFVTPFKGGKRPEGLTPMGLKDKMQAVTAGSAPANAHPRASFSKKSVIGTSRGDIVRRDKAKVFDLEGVSPCFAISSGPVKDATDFSPTVQQLREASPMT